MRSWMRKMRTWIIVSAMSAVTVCIFCTGDAASDDDNEQDDDEGKEPAEDRGREESGAERESDEDIFSACVIEYVSDRAVMYARSECVGECAVGHECLANGRVWLRYGFKSNWHRFADPE